MNILPSQFGLLKQSLDLAQVNQQIVGQNIANVNTPNYQAQEARFGDQLEALTSTNGENSAEIVIAATSDPTNRRDGNNVDIDRELGKLNKSALLFRTFTELLSTRLDEVRKAMELR